MIAHDELIARADANYFDTMRTAAAQIDGGEVRERGGLLIAATGLPVAMLNIAFVTRPLAAADSLLREAISYFDSRGVPFLVRVRESVDDDSERAAQALGLDYRDSVPGMVLSPVPPSAPACPGLEVRRVGDMASLEQYADVMAEGFGMPREWGRAFCAPALLALRDVSLYTGFIDGEPAATSALFMNNRVAGVYNVATLDPYRQRGIGAAMSWRAVLDGAAADCAMASLQASEMGKPVYERMGFRHMISYETYVRPSL